MPAITQTKWPLTKSEHASIDKGKAHPVVASLALRYPRLLLFNADAFAHHSVHLGEKCI